MYLTFTIVYTCTLITKFHTVFQIFTLVYNVALTVLKFINHIYMFKIRDGLVMDSTVGKVNEGCDM